MNMGFRKMYGEFIYSSCLTEGKEVCTGRRVSTGVDESSLLSVPFFLSEIKKNGYPLGQSKANDRGLMSEQ